MAGRGRRAARAARRVGGRIGGSILNRVKPNLMPAGAGAAGELAVEFAAEHLEFVNRKWWGGPAAKFGAALVFRRPQLSHALAGAAGAEAVFNYKLMQFQTGKAPRSPVRDFTDKGMSAPASSNTSMREEPDEDAGMLFGSN